MARNLADLIPAIFTGPDGRPLSEDQIRSRQMIAKSLLQNATDTSPNAGGWASILAKGVQGFAAGRQNRAADLGAEAATKADSDIAATLLGSYGDGSSMPMPAAAGEIAATSPSPSTAMPIFADDGTELGAYLSDEARRATLPAGMRNNNPGNIKYVGQKVPGIVGPSVNTDQGDPQAVFDTPESGMRAMYSLLGKKYAGGKLTPNQMIAGDMGWTPGNFQAAANVARTMGIRPDEDIGFKDPAKAARFMQALILQEHGQKGRLYPESLVMSAIGGRPTQVAASTPQAAMASLPAQNVSPAVAAIEAAAPGSGYVDPQVTTAYAAPAPMPVTSEPLAPIGQMDTVSQPTVSPVAQALIASKGDRIGSPPAISQQDFNSRFGGDAVSSGPEIFSQPQDFAQGTPQNDPTTTGALPQQVAPAQPLPQPQLPSAPRLNPAVIKALSSPYASPQTKAVAKSLLEQNIAQRRAVEEQTFKIQQQQQAIRQRQAVAQQLGIDPVLAGDDAAWTQAVGGGNLINAGNGNLYDSRSRQWITAPNAGNKNFRQATPEEVKTYGTNGQVGPDGKFYPITPPQGTSLSVDPTTGAVSFNQGAGVKPLTEGQSKDTFFNTRMEAALPTLEANENSLLNLGGKVADAIPMNLGNYAQSEDYQLARDAGRDFVTAYLRKDSGAAITPQEEKIYGELLLPQPGDRPPTIEAKRQRRKVAVEAIKAGMPQQALDNALRAIKASGGDKAIVPTDIPGVTIRRVN